MPRFLAYVCLHLGKLAPLKFSKISKHIHGHLFSVDKRDVGIIQCHTE